MKPRSRARSLAGPRGAGDMGERGPHPGKVRGGGGGGSRGGRGAREAGEHPGSQVVSSDGSSSFHQGNAGLPQYRCPGEIRGQQLILNVRRQTQRPL